jgi:hypothetical protein
MPSVTEDLAISQLAIADGAWQESPDTISQFDEVALFGTRTGRGNLYVVVEIEGDVEGRDAIARELIETARREFGASRGSLTVALTQALRAVNDAFYNLNASLPPELRRIAGMTVGVLREGELFIAQAGPGLACIQRARELRRYPYSSPWFEPDEGKLAEWLGLREFTTPGIMPLGLRRDYSPDVFRASLQPGDGIVISTRALANLLTNDELLDTIADRHPDEITASLEELAGAADLNVIVLRLPGENTLPVSLYPPIPEDADEREEIEPELVAFAPLATDSFAPNEIEPEPEPSEWNEPEPAEPMIEPEPVEEEPLETEPLEDESFPAPAIASEPAPTPMPTPRPPRPSIDLAPARAGALRALAGFFALIAGAFTHINWQGIGAGIDRFINAILRGIVGFLLLTIGRIVPGEPKENAKGNASPVARTAWQLAALIFPVMLVFAGSGTWVSYRSEVQRRIDNQNTTWVNEAKRDIENARTMLGRGDKTGAREQLLAAIQLTDKVKAINPKLEEARKVAFDAQDELDKLNGVAIVFPVSFANFTEAKASPGRIITRSPDVFILDRGLQRVYRYTFNDTGSTLTPAGTDGIILKSGDKIETRTVGEMIDMTLIDSGRIVVLDRSGAFLIFDPTKPIPQGQTAMTAWSARTANDANQWKGVNLISSYSGNLYVSDPGRNQIMKYVAPSEGMWSSAVTYFAPDVRADMSNVLDMALDENVWLLRGDGSIFRYNAGKPNDLRVAGLETPLVKPTALTTAQSMTNVYIADAGNQRFVQIDKVSGKFTRQLKPTSQFRDTFQSLKALAVDEANRRFFFINGTQAYLAAIPQ